MSATEYIMNRARYLSLHPESEDESDRKVFNAHDRATRLLMTAEEKQRVRDAQREQKAQKAAECRAQRLLAAKPSADEKAERKEAKPRRNAAGAAKKNADGRKRGGAGKEIEPPAPVLMVPDELPAEANEDDAKVVGGGDVDVSAVEVLEAMQVEEDPEEEERPNHGLVNGSPSPPQPLLGDPSQVLVADNIDNVKAEPKDHASPDSGNDENESESDENQGDSDVSDELIDRGRGRVKKSTVGNIKCRCGCRQMFPVRQVIPCRKCENRWINPGCVNRTYSCYFCSKLVRNIAEPTDEDEDR
jgi:hypothetical protein